VADYCTGILGLETYYPRLRQQRVIRRRKRIVLSALFPRYLFCRFDAAALYRAVRYAPEVLNVVEAGGRPTVVDDNLISTLKGWAGQEVDIVTLRPPPQVGSEVEIVSGPMQGLSGILMENCKEQDRVTVLLSFLQCGAQIRVPSADIRLIA
jgi:transcriptional antiterminator RfaH